MLSNPLFWMEMQFLSEARKRETENILPVWKSLRPFLANADVKPIGDKPSGRSFTGFEISNGNRAKYLLLFREVTDSDHACILTDTVCAEAAVLASNTDAWARVFDGHIEISLAKPRSYALIELTYPEDKRMTKQKIYPRPRLSLFLLFSPPLSYGNQTWFDRLRANKHFNVQQVQRFLLRKSRSGSALYCGLSSISGVLAYTLPPKRKGPPQGGPFLLGPSDRT